MKPDYYDSSMRTTDEGTGTPYSELSLPYIEDSVPYHEYIVVGRCEVECLVDKGTVAPGFGSEGGAVQDDLRHVNAWGITERTWYDS